MNAKQIKVKGITKFTNGGHLGIIADSLQTADTPSLTALAIILLRDALQAAYDKEDAAFKVVQKYEVTPQVEAEHKARLENLSYALGIIRTSLKSPNIQVRDAAKHADHVATPYKKASTKGYVECSQYIANLLQDFALPENKSAVTKLSLDSALADLAEKNDLFNETYNRHFEETERRRAIGKLVELRLVSDAAYADLVNAINALHTANELTTKDETKRATLLRLIDGLNAVIDKYEQYEAHRGKKKQEAPPKP